MLYKLGTANDAVMPDTCPLGAVWTAWAGKPHPVDEGTHAPPGHPPLVVHACPLRVPPEQNDGPGAPHCRPSLNGLTTPAETHRLVGHCASFAHSLPALGPASHFRDVKICRAGMSKNV